MPAFLSAVLRERLGQGIRAGVVAAASTTGVLIGFGIARGTPLLPLNSVAHMAFGTRAYLTEGFDVAVTSVALLLHFLSIALWGVIFALVAARLRGTTLIAASLLFGLAASLIDYFVAPERLRPGFERALSTPELAVVYVVLALSMPLGLHLGRVADAHA